MKLKKKGFFADPLVDAWAFITYALIVIIFFVIFSFGKGEIKVEVNEDMGNMDYYIVLRNFLRTPATLEFTPGGGDDWSGAGASGAWGKEVVEPNYLENIPEYLSVADLIPLSELEKNNDYYKSFVEQAKKFFDKQFDGEAWELWITDLSTGSNLQVFSYNVLSGDRTFLADQIIPGYNGKNYKIEIYSATTDIPLPSGI